MIKDFLSLLGSIFFVLCVGLSLSFCTLQSEAAPVSETKANRFILQDETSANKVTLKTQTIAVPYALTLPADDGAANQFLKTDGNGLLSWAGIDLTTDVTGVLPVANGGTNSSSFTAGSVVFAGAGGTSLTQDNAGIFYDDSNNRLGLGIATPQQQLHIDAGTGIASLMHFTNGATTGQAATDGFVVGISAGGVAQLRQREALGFQFFTNNLQAFTIMGNGSVGVQNNSGTQLATNATTGHFFIPSTAGTPTGTPTAINGTRPIIIDTTNSLFYFYDGSAWVTPTSPSPLTTKGDLFTFTTVDARLPVGADGFILSANSATATGLEWISAPVTGATTALDNLASVAINTSLISDTDNIDDLGSDSIEWKDLWAYNIKHNSAGTPALTISTTGNNGNISLEPNGTGIVSATKAIKSLVSLILEDPGAGTNTTTIQAGVPTSSYTLTLPTTSGSANQCLTTDGSGNLAWGACGASSAYFVGSVSYAGAINCNWLLSSTTYANFPADTDCSTPTVTGELTAAATKVPGFQITKKVGTYLIIPRHYASLFSTSVPYSFRMTDGTNNSTEVNALNRDASTGDYLPLGAMTLISTGSGAVTMQLQGKSTADTITVVGNITSQVYGFDVYFMPNEQSTSETVQRVAFGGASEVSNCTSSPCTIYRSTSGIASVTRSGTGSYTLNFNSGTWSSAPVCNCTGAAQGGGLLCIAGGNPSTSAWSFNIITSGISNIDGAAQIICSGPR